MEILTTWGLTAAVTLLAIPVSVFFVEILAAVALKQRQRTLSGADRGRVAVLVPAHNESLGILPTIEDVRRQLRAGDRLLVVADNCTDNTAVLAAAAGAEVIERRDLARRGKGYALDFGLQHLASRAPDVVIMIDADCRLDDGAIDQLGAACAATGRPAQGLYLMRAPGELNIRFQVAEFAWRVKNWLRPSGLSALGLPTQLVGTGMAFSWPVIRSANLASPAIVEDLKLGLDLAESGSAPLFCPGARVTSHFASSRASVSSQRRRWEQGHINVIMEMVPRLLRQAVARRDRNLLALALDLTVPPLSLLGLLLLTAIVITVIYARFGFSQVPLAISAANLAAFLIASAFAWVAIGREVLPARTIWLIAPYVLAKAGLMVGSLWTGAIPGGSELIERTRPKEEKDDGRSGSSWHRAK